MLTPLSARAALLQALTVPGYGLDLIERVRRGSGGRVSLRMGSVYPALLSLERQGLVRRRRIEGRRRGRPRRYYELTVAGVRAAMDEREALLGLLRIPEGAAVDPGVLRERMERCSDLSAAVRRLEARLGEAKGRT
jgi:PadR family transcriptional regulator PadR